MLIMYNLYPEHGTVGSWEQRCACIATCLCCRQNVRRPSGRHTPLRSIAELTSGLLSHTDLDATDLMAAVILTSAAQNRRRRLRLAKALLPVYAALEQAPDGRRTRVGPQRGSRVPGPCGNGEAAGTPDAGSMSGSDDGSGSESGSSSSGSHDSHASSRPDMPSSRRLSRRLLRDSLVSLPPSTADAGTVPVPTAVALPSARRSGTIAPMARTPSGALEPERAGSARPRHARTRFALPEPPSPAPDAQAEGPLGSRPASATSQPCTAPAPSCQVTAPHPAEPPVAEPATHLPLTEDTVALVEQMSSMGGGRVEPQASLPAMDAGKAELDDEAVVEQVQSLVEPSSHGATGFARVGWHGGLGAWAPLGLLCRVRPASMTPGRLGAA